MDLYDFYMLNLKQLIWLRCNIVHNNYPFFFIMFDIYFVIFGKLMIYNQIYGIWFKEGGWTYKLEKEPIICKMKKWHCVEEGRGLPSLGENLWASKIKWLHVGRTEERKGRCWNWIKKEEKEEAGQPATQERKKELKVRGEKVELVQCRGVRGEKVELVQCRGDVRRRNAHSSSSLFILITSLFLLYEQLKSFVLGDWNGRTS